MSEQNTHHEREHDDEKLHQESHAGHTVDHTGHEQMFRRRFWICLVLSVPVLLFSPAVQSILPFEVPSFPSS